MVQIKSYLAETLVGKRVHFQCDCILKIDVIGSIKGWSLHNDEILWDVLTDNGKIIKIGENHPNMNIEVL